MTRLGLRDSILVLTLIPTMLIGLILGGYFTVNRYVELEEILFQRGSSISEPLAIALEQPVLREDRAQLKRIVSTAHNKHSPLIKTIAVFDVEKELLLTSNYHEHFGNLNFTSDIKALHHTDMVKKDNTFIFFTPVKFNSQPSEQWQDAHAAPLALLVIEVSKDKAIIAQQQTLIMSISIIVIALILSGILSLRISKVLVSPLSKLLLATDKLVEGKQDIGLQAPMQGEFELLRQGLHTINGAMANQRDEMQKHIDQATSDYRETLEQYETQNIQLNIAKKEAQDANRVKSDFLAKMSHELRTPLNGVIGFTRQLYKTPLNKHQKEYLDTIELSANSLMTIISDILDFSKLEAGAMELESIHFQLREVISEVMTLLAPSAYEKKLELSISIHPHVPENLVGDPTRLKQVLINLISNAIKFTEKGAVKIDITHRVIKQTNASLLVSVSDTGVGIAAEKQDALFTPFGQADSSITRKFGGTGLGLIITKHIVEAMRGSISLNSAPGQGTCFTFNAIFELPQRAFNNDLPTYSLENKRILFFEPQEHTHYAILAQLHEWNMQVTPCLTEETFYQALEKDFSYDICLIGNTADVEQMPVLKNYISQARPLADYLYLMVSTISHNMRESLVGSGADACASKPLHYRKLCEMLAAPYRLDHPDVSTDEHDQTILPLKALIADDNDANLKLLSTLLSEQIEGIDTAHNGAQAVALCKTHKYDLIFMDIQMPIMDGITACKTILDSSLNEDTPIIAVTAHALSGEKDQLLKDGFSGYLTKPIDEDMLKQTICDYSSSSVSSTTKVKSEEVEPSPAPFESHLLDWPLALRHAGGKPDLAIEMLNMLLDSLNDTHQQINQALENEDFALLLSVIHKFHGACCYTGVPKLKQLSETIETGLKRHQNITDVEPEVLELLDELENFKQVSKQVS